MFDKIELRIPFAASFRRGFRFLPGEVRYEGLTTPIKRSLHYSGVCDLRPFQIAAILHLNFKRSEAQRNHKLELLETGKKSLRQMRELIGQVFDVEPDFLELMRVDLAADLDGVTLASAYSAIRVKFKRSACAIGEQEFETIGGKRLEYFRYGKSPNCVRVYDKVAECRARFPALLKRSNPDAEPPSFDEMFGFPRDAIRTRVEIQIGGGKIPPELKRFGSLSNALIFNPFSRVEVVRDEFPFPDPKVYGVGKSLTLAGIQSFIKRYGYQQARATLNCDRNANRIMAEFDRYVEEFGVKGQLSLEEIRNSFRRSVASQIDGSN